jgi:hypothetical protein
MGPSTIAVVEKSPLIQPVVVWAIFTLPHWRGPHTDRDFRQDRGLEDTLLSNQGDPLPIEEKPRRQNGPRKDITVERCLLAQKVERPQADCAIERLSGGHVGDQTSVIATKSTA